MKPLVLPVLLVMLASVAGAQEGSLFYQQPAPGQAAGPTLLTSSFLYEPLPPDASPRQLQKQDIVRVLVDYRSVQQSDASSESIKTGIFNSVLTDWIRFDGRNLFPALQQRGDPTIGGSLNSQLRAESDIEQRQSLTITLAAKVVDIRPNGNLILEGRSEVRDNEEIWNVYLTGEVARQQIGPDLIVRDSDLANKRIHKYEVGAVRDGAQRGWLSRLYGKYKAF